MNNDAYLEQALLDEKFKPMPGHVICMKQSKNVVLDVAGLGAISASCITDSGLALVSSDTQASEHVKAMMVTVVAMGDNPYKWETRVPGNKKRKEVHDTTWSEQQIGIGTVLSIRPIAGVNQTKDSPFLDLRYDEISCIGQPFDDENSPDMLPAPGWVLVKLDETQKQDRSGIVIEDGLEEILQNGNMLYGEILGLPKGYGNGDLSVGDLICFPAHGGVGAIEFVEFDGGLRALPMHDVLGVAELDHFDTIIRSVERWKDYFEDEGLVDWTDGNYGN